MADHDRLCIGGDDHLPTRHDGALVTTDTTTDTAVTTVGVWTVDPRPPRMNRDNYCLCAELAGARADERERLRAQVEEMYAAAIRYYEASGHSHGMGQMDAFKRVLRLLGGESDE